MKNWSASVIDRYYLDPTIEPLQSGNGDIREAVATSYYIVAHCSRIAVTLSAVSRQSISGHSLRGSKRGIGFVRLHVLLLS
jgi:hypothetical protein